MGTNKSSISKSQSYQGIGKFWDTHDVTDYWDQTNPVEFDVDISSEARYCALEKGMASKLSNIAWEKGISVETLINLWISERLQNEMTQAF